MKLPFKATSARPSVQYRAACRLRRDVCQKPCNGTRCASPRRTTTDCTGNACAHNPPLSSRQRTLPRKSISGLLPIALYPDALLSQILMASTYPANVIQAAQWSKDNPKMEGRRRDSGRGEPAMGSQREIAGGVPSVNVAEWAETRRGYKISAMRFSRNRKT